MRRPYRTGAAAAATATLLTGAGIALASLREATPPAEVATISSVSTPAEPDLETLDAELAQLRSEAKDLKAEIAARRKAAKERAASDDTESGATGASPQTTAGAPDVHATTGASGSGEDQESDEDEHEESGEDD